MNAFETVAVLITHHGVQGDTWPLLELFKDKIEEPIQVIVDCLEPLVRRSMDHKAKRRQSIPQLILMREIKLTKSERQLLPQMDEIRAPQADHQAYREVLRNINSPFAIPWLGAHWNLPFPSVKPNIVRP
jgi:hypothetical protein